MDIKKLNESLNKYVSLNETLKDVNIEITPKLITGKILGKPISDSGYRPMFFPEHMPDFSKWKEEFRIGTINKDKNINVDGSIEVEKDVLYYIPAKPYTYTAMRYSVKDECWKNHGSWTCNQYARTTNGEYDELMRCTDPISVEDANNLINNDTLNVVKDFEKFFKSVGESDKEKIAFQIFKVIKKYL